MNNFRLHSLGEDWFDKRYSGNKLYGGTYAKNELPILKKKFYIVNLDKSTGQGTHWVLVSNVRDNYVDYIDPMGEVYAPQDVEKKMKETNKMIYRNSYQIQPIASEACGYFCSIIADYIIENPEKSPFIFIEHTFLTGKPASFLYNQQLLRNYFKKNK